MRRLVVALFVVLLAFSLVGCGGGGEEEQPATTDQNQAAQQAAPPATAARPGQDAAPIEDRSIESSETFVVFSSKDATPPAVAQRLEAKQAMILYFYDSSQLQADDVREQVEAVADDNRGDVDLLTYDLGKFVSVNASGFVEVEEDKLANNENASVAARFARVAGVDHLPYVIIVDDQGYKIFWARGFIDAELLERQVERASR